MTIPDVNITPGGSASVVISVDFGTLPYTAYQFDIAYPEGITSQSDAEGNPSFTKGDIYAPEKHSVSSVYTDKGLDRFQCFSTTSVPFTAQNGTLLILPINAKKSMALGTYQAVISPIEFVQTDATPDRPYAITFNINVTNEVVLDENAIVAPAAATGVDVRVKRTIPANVWATICLPFSMTTEQVKEAFGDEVQLADFKGCNTTKDEDENVVGITVKFADVTAIEANHPYIIKVSDLITEFTVDGVNVNAVEEPSVDCDENIVKVGKNTYTSYNRFIGTYTVQTEVPEKCLFLSNNQFWYATEETQPMKAYRAYFDFYDVLSDVENANSRMHMVFNNETTDIHETMKYGQRTMNCFDLQGRPVVTPKKGLYIKNGKKHVIK